MRQPPINKHYGHIFGQKHRLCQLLIHIVIEYDWIKAQLALNLWEQWWDPILPIHITNHVWHFCDDLGWFMLKDDKGQQKVTLCNHLWCLIPFYNTLQCTLLHLRPFLTFSDAFGSFVTFLDFTLFNTPDSFSGAFHQILFTWLLHHSFGLSGIISGRSALCFTDVSHFIQLLQLYWCFLSPLLPNTIESSSLQPSYSVLTSDLVVLLVVLVLAHVSCISHQSLLPFLELCHTISMDLSLTWMTFSDYFQVPYHYIYTLILPLFTEGDRLPLP